MAHVGPASGKVVTGYSKTMAPSGREACIEPAKPRAESSDARVVREGRANADGDLVDQSHEQDERGGPDHEPTTSVWAGAAESVQLPGESQQPAKPILDLHA